MRRNMESNSRAPALEMNEKDEEMVHQKKSAFNLFNMLMWFQSQTVYCMWLIT